MANNVSISLQSGGLGRSLAIDDGVAGLIVSGVTVGTYTAGNAYLVTGLAEVEAQGLTSAYDTTNSTKAWMHISDFFIQNPGGKLWFMIVPNTVLMSALVDVSTPTVYASKLLDTAQGAVKVLGITRNEDGAYTPTITAEIDANVTLAVTNANALAVARAAVQQPLQILIECRGYSGTAGTLKDFRLNSHQYVSVVLGSQVGGTYKGGDVGLCLGRMCAIPVSSNIGNVAFGNIGKTAMYITGSTTIESLTTTALGVIADKGYIIPRWYVGKAGYFYYDDPTCIATTSDYAQATLARTINKAARILYLVYLEQMLNNVKVDPATGKIRANSIKALQQVAENQLNLNMNNPGGDGVTDNLSGLSVFIDPAQNVIATSQLIVQVRLVPQGILRNIVIKLGYALTI